MHINSIEHEIGSVQFLDCTCSRDRQFSNHESEQIPYSIAQSFKFSHSCKSDQGLHFDTQAISPVIHRM